MSGPNTKQQLRGIIKAANAGPQSSDMGPVNPDDEPSTSRQAQQGPDGLRLQSKAVSAVDSEASTLCKPTIECCVLQRQSSEDSTNAQEDACDWDHGDARDLESNNMNLSSIRSGDWSYWSETLSNDDLVVPMDSIFPLSPIPTRVSFCNALVRSLCDWTKRIVAGFGLTHQETSSAWYKHCWDTHGHEYNGHSTLNLRTSFELDCNSRPIATSTPTPTPTRESSSTMTTAI